MKQWWYHVLAIWLVCLSAQTAVTQTLPQDSAFKTSQNAILDEATALVTAGEAQEEAGNYQAALAAYSKAVQIREGILGARHLELADALSGVASVYHEQGQHQKAHDAYLRVLAIEEATLGKNHADVGITLNNLGLVHEAQGEYAKSEAAYVRAIQIDEARLGDGHIDLVVTLGNLATLYGAVGQTEDRLRVAKRILTIRQTHLGGSHIDVARSLFLLAKTYLARGELARAEPLFARALEIEEGVLGEWHPDLAETLDEMGYLFWQLGKYDAAFDALDRALEIRREAYPENHLKIGESLNNFGLLYMAGNEFAEAQHWFERSLKIYEKYADSKAKDIAVLLGNLASSMENQGKAKEALPLLLRAIRIDEKRLPPHHPKMATNLNNLAMTYSVLGDFDQAITLYPRVFKMLEAAYGDKHPRIGMAHYNLATIYAAKGELAKTGVHVERSFEIERAYIGANVKNLVAETTRGFVNKFDYPRRLSLTLAAQNSDQPELHRIAARTVTEGKGLAGESERQQSDLARKQMLYMQQIQRTQSELSARAFSSSASPERIAGLQDRLRLLKTQQAKLGQQSEVNQKRTLAAIRQALTQEQALLDFAVYEPYEVTQPDREQNREPHMAAVIIRRHLPPKVVGLGPASVIDALVSKLREDFVRRQSSVTTRSQALYAVLMAPLASALSGASELIVSPDGALHLLPFGALVDAEGALVSSRYTVRYLTTSRQLVALSAPGLPARSESVLIADASFGGEVPREAVASQRGLSGALPARMVPLPGTRREANRLGSLLSKQGRSLYLGKAASEAQLRALRGPRILHVATHGFFLPDEEGAEPMLRSGLALSGFDTRQARPHDDDGLLTALDISSLDLYGTELVVLSACETGLGEVAQGDGVFGLKRALALAGSRSQVLSLWKVDDNATAALMAAFYERLLKGESRAAALRSVQLDMASGRIAPKGRQGGERGVGRGQVKGKVQFPGWQHPYYWASFTLSGADGPIEMAP